MFSVFLLVAPKLNVFKTALQHSVLLTINNFVFFAQ